MRHVRFLLTLTLLGAGCARYEYDVVSPQPAAGHVGRKGDHSFALDPLEYKLRTVDNRLVVRVYNPTSEPVTLLGGRSAAVDPDGQSHPLITQTIAPGGSFIKLILPPPRPRVYGGGSTFGIGVGVGTYPHHHHHHRSSIDSWPDDDGPRYMTVYDDNDTYYWDWKGEGQARLNLVYARGEAPDGGGRASTFAY
jgi:hypothetical protein